MAVVTHIVSFTSLHERLYVCPLVSQQFNAAAKHPDAWSHVHKIAITGTGLYSRPAFRVRINNHDADYGYRAEQLVDKQQFVVAVMRNCCHLTEVSIEDFPFNTSLIQQYSTKSKQMLHKLMAETKAHKTFDNFYLVVDNKEHVKHLNGWLHGADIRCINLVYPRAAPAETLPPLSVLLKDLQPNVCDQLRAQNLPMLTQQQYFGHMPDGVFSRVQCIEANWGQA